VGGLVGLEIIDSSNKVCAAPAKTSFADDVIPIFKGYCFSATSQGDKALTRADWTSAATKGS
jgi:hypothetical protein